MITILNPKCGEPEETQTEREQRDAPPINEPPRRKRAAVRVIFPTLSVSLKNTFLSCDDVDDDAPRDQN